MMNIRTRYVGWMAAGVMLSFAACDDNNDAVEAEVDEDGVEVDTSSRGTGAAVQVDAQTAQLALDELTVGVDTTITGFSTANPPPPGTGTAPGAPAATRLDVACSGGGAATVDGYVNIVPLPVHVDVRVGIAYAGCVTERGSTIAGEIEFSQTVQAAGVPLRVETIYTGDVQLRGAVNARCSVDLNVLVDEAGRAIQVAGSFCGRDAAELNMQIMPRWGAAQ